MSQNIPTEEDEFELTREPDPDADRPYEEEYEFIPVHTYGKGWSSIPVPPRDLNGDIDKKTRRTLDLFLYGNAIGSGFSPAEVAEAENEQGSLMRWLDERIANER